MIFGNIDKQLSSVSFQTHYTLLSGVENLSISCPVDGYVNILLPSEQEGGTLQVEGRAYTPSMTDSILCRVTIGQQVAWNAPLGGVNGILLFIPFDVLCDFNIADNEAIVGTGFFTKRNQRLDFAIEKLIELVRYVDLNRQVNRLLIKSLILEAIALQIQGLYVESERPELFMIKDHYDRVLEVKRIIDSDLTETHTIAELAKRVGTNEQYLKRYFKQQFGMTIMTYITKTKMEYAKTLIITGRYRIAEVAQLTGFKHATHFTTAFKRYFGFIPNALRYLLWCLSEDWLYSESTAVWYAYIA